MMQSTVSVIIPLYNGRAFVERAISSALTQSSAASEIVVVDDGSTDNGPEIVERLARSESRIRLLRKPNGGQASARNLGASAASGNLLAFLDQDDVWYRDHVKILRRHFQRDDDGRLGFVYSDLDIANEGGDVWLYSYLNHLGQPNPVRTIFQMLERNLNMLPSATMVSKRAFDKAGGFDEAFRGYEDDDLFIRMFLGGFRNEFVGVSLSKWRQHQQSSGRSPTMVHSRSRFIVKFLDLVSRDESLAPLHLHDILRARFFPAHVHEYLSGLRASDLTRMRSAIADMMSFAPYLTDDSRVYLDKWRHFLASGLAIKFPSMARRLASKLFTCRCPPVTAVYYTR